MGRNWRKYCAEGFREKWYSQLSMWVVGAIGTILLSIVCGRIAYQFAIAYVICSAILQPFWEWVADKIDPIEKG